jgi:hypothetical protein
MDQEVTKYIQSRAPWQVEVCETLRGVVHQAVPDAEEKIAYGKPHFAKNGENFAALHVAKNKVSFVLFNASDLAEVKGVLRGVGGGDRKVIDITENQEVDTAFAADVVKQVAS